MRWTTLQERADYSHAHVIALPVWDILCKRSHVIPKHPSILCKDPSAHLSTLATPAYRAPASAHCTLRLF